MRDLDILNISDNTGKASIDGVGGVVTGIRLLAQRIVIIFLTKYDDLLRQNEGTGLLGNIGSGQVSLSYAGLIMTSAIASVIEILNDSTDDTTPDSERISDLRIQDIRLEGDRILFDLYVTNKANESTTISSHT